MAFTFIQLLIDVILVAGLLLVLLGRGWRRAAPSADADPAASREFIASLSGLIREMKETAAGLEERLEAKIGQVERATALADDRLAKLEAAGMRAGPPSSGATAPAVRTSAVPSRAVAPSSPGAVAEPVDGTDAGDLDDDTRADRYRQVVDFARKGWDAAEIARHTRLPRGEVDLLLKTRGRER